MFAKIFILCTIPLQIYGHTYHLGGECAHVEPMPDFIMDKFVGRWYAIQKTSTASRCMVYNFYKTEYRKIYNVQQLSENPVIGLVKDNVYRYTGKLEIKDENMQADMDVKFPLNVAGKASFIVFMTDYDNYAGIYSCQKIGFAHRQSATILSRMETLDKAYIDKVRNRLASFNVNPFDLNEIGQTNCSIEDTPKFTIDIDQTTFQKENLKKTLKTVGSAINEGVDFIIKGAKKVYEAVKTDGLSDTVQQQTMREEMTPRNYDAYEPDAEMYNV